MTNFEKIKNMSVEEMAMALACPAEYDVEFNRNQKCNGEMNRNCFKCALEWLESEVEE